MRRLVPRVAVLLTWLLLAVWGQSASACLASLRLDPARVLCHADGAGALPGAGADAGACPHCAPLPPPLAAAPPSLPAPSSFASPAPAPEKSERPAVTTRRPDPQQPRAPPARA